jgi:hypothetical protein
MGRRRDRRGCCQSTSRPIWRCGHERQDNERWPLDQLCTRSFIEDWRRKGGREGPGVAQAFIHPLCIFLLSANEPVPQRVENEVQVLTPSLPSSTTRYPALPELSPPSDEYPPFDLFTCFFSHPLSPCSPHLPEREHMTRLNKVHV